MIEKKTNAGVEGLLINKILPMAIEIESYAASLKAKIEDNSTFNEQYQIYTENIKYGLHKKEINGMSQITLDVLKKYAACHDIRLNLVAITEQGVFNNTEKFHTCLKNINEAAQQLIPRRNGDQHPVINKLLDWLSKATINVLGKVRGKDLANEIEKTTHKLFDHTPNDNTCEREDKSKPFSFSRTQK